MARSSPASGPRFVAGSIDIRIRFGGQGLDRKKAQPGHHDQRRRRDFQERKNPSPHQLLRLLVFVLAMRVREVPVGVAQTDVDVPMAVRLARRFAAGRGP